MRTSGGPAPTTLKVTLLPSEAPPALVPPRSRVLPGLAVVAVVGALAAAALAQRGRDAPRDAQAVARPSEQPAASAEGTPETVDGGAPEEGDAQALAPADTVVRPTPADGGIACGVASGRTVMT